MSCIINNGSAYKIKDNPREDLLALEMVENIFKKRRAHIISMPKKGSSVVCCMSGGMDTVANAAILMEEFNFKIYPLFINRGQTNYRWEKESVEFFDSFFSSRYPTLYNKYIEIQLDTPPIAYKNNLRNTKKMTDNPVLRSNVAYPARNPIIALTAMEYAYSLQSKGVFAKTIFAVHTADDPVLHSTLTAVRMANLLMCQITSDFNWQFISLPIEKEFGNYYGKEVMVKWCAENNIPIEKSRSCYKDQQNHCGECFPACQNRKEAFKKAGVHDKTIYNQNEGF
jgi:7-cyano-7-deazaguanine synthase in queuosine biosynthesis